MLTVVLWCGRCRTYRQITTPISQGGDNIISGMYAEIARAKHLHGNASIHNPALSVTQAAGILLEEIGEMITHVLTPHTPEFREEAIQVMACLHGLLNRE